jgi:outer membrane protein
MNFKKITLLAFVCIFMVLYGLQVCAEDKIPLNIDEFLQKVCNNNPGVMQKRYDWLIKAELAKKEWAAFEPDLILSYTHKDSSTQNTAEQYFDRTTNTFDEKTENRKIEIQGVIPVSGTEYALGSYWNTTSSNLVKSRYQGLGVTEEYQNTLELKPTQPLLKNAWETGTMSKIKMAAIEDKIEYKEYQKNVMNLAAKASGLYWDLYYSVKQLNIFQDSERIAFDLLNSANEQFKVGKIGKGDVYKAEMGLSVRRTLSSQAQQQLQQVRNYMSTVLFESLERGANTYVPVSDLSFIENYPEIDYEQSLKNAMANDPDYQISLKTAEKEGIRLAYAKNQHLPQLDLSGTYSFNSLDTSDSWNISSGEYPTWSLGLVARIPLGGGIDTAKDLRAAQMRKKQAQLKIQADILRLTTDMDTVLESASQTIAQLKEHNKNVEINRKMLGIELSHLKAGKSDIQKILNIERDLNVARKEQLKTQIGLEKIGVNFLLIEGTLLQKHGISLDIPQSDLLPPDETKLTKRPPVLPGQNKPEGLKTESLQNDKQIKQAVEEQALEEDISTEKRKKDVNTEEVHWVDGIQPVLVGWAQI